MPRPEFPLSAELEPLRPGDLAVNVGGYVFSIIGYAFNTGESVEAYIVNYSYGRWTVTGQTKVVSNPDGNLIHISLEELQQLRKPGRSQSQKQDTRSWFSERWKTGPIAERKRREFAEKKRQVREMRRALGFYDE